MTYLIFRWGANIQYREVRRLAKEIVGRLLGHITANYFSDQP